MELQRARSRAAAVYLLQIIFCPVQSLDLQADLHAEICQTMTVEEGYSQSWL